MAKYGLMRRVVDLKIVDVRMNHGSLNTKKILRRLHQKLLFILLLIFFITYYYFLYYLLLNVVIL